MIERKREECGIHCWRYRCEGWVVCEGVARRWLSRSSEGPDKGEAERIAERDEARVG